MFSIERDYFRFYLVVGIWNLFFLVLWQLKFQKRDYFSYGQVCGKYGGIWFGLKMGIVLGEHKGVQNCISEKGL